MGNLDNVGFGNDFLHMTPKSEATKAKINKGDYSKLKTSVWPRKPPIR